MKFCQCRATPFNKCASFRKATNAFTLLETLLVLSLICFFSFSMVVTYRQWVEDHQLSAIVSSFTDVMEEARHDAMMLHAPIIFCASSDGRVCGSDWEKGQLVLNARDHRVLRVLPALPAGYRCAWKSTLGASTDLRWQTDGFTEGQQGTFFISKQSPSAISARIIILRTGRLRVVMGN